MIHTYFLYLSLPSPAMPTFLLLLFLLVSLSSTLSLTHPSDTAALKSFLSGISPSSIPSFSCLATWRSPSDPTTFSCGLRIDTTLSPPRVTHITLDPAGYSGTLSPQISSLSSLIVLDLSDNNFHGPIPLSLSSLPNLETLILKLNKFSGKIPPSVSLSLETLDLSHNSLSGSLDSLPRSSGLRRLDLSFNSLIGKLPKLPPNLIELAIKGNKLTGSLAKSSFAESTRLEVVELGSNLFSGTLNHWFFLLPSLQQVDLANNSFTRVEIWKVSNADESNLVAVDLGFNKIEGTVPENFSGYPLLSALSLRYNQLRGPIPTGLGKKGSYLKRLYLDGNYLNGVPPEELISGMTSLSGSLGDNCLAKCPVSSELCVKSQKPTSLCRQAYGGKPRS